MHRSVLAGVLFVVPTLSAVGLAAPASAAPGDLTLASTSDNGTKGNDSSYHASMSADGTKIAFYSRASNLDPADTDDSADIYVKDLVSGNVTLASTSDAGIKGNTDSYDPSLSADGTKVAFYTYANNLDPADTDSVHDIYVKDLVSGNVTLASTSDNGTKGNVGNYLPSLSADGTKVAFISNETTSTPPTPTSYSTCTSRT